MYLPIYAQRDTASPGPDLGYHYDPIDYAFSGVVVNNASVTVGPGTVIGTFGTNGSPYGLSIGTGAQLICEGAAYNLNRIVTYNTVQEESGNGWQAPTLGSITDYIGGAGGMFDFQFTDWSMFGPANASHLIIDQSNPVNMRDCQFHGGSLVTYLGPTINLTNCLFDRVYLALYPDDTNTPVLRNNLFYGGTLDLLPFGTSHSVVQDNLFDRTTILDHNPPCTYTGYNAYVTNYNRLQPTTTYDIILTNSPAYQTGPLGNYYQPMNSPLIDKGSESVDDAALTGYTILTNQTPDTGTVDIGYHYSILSAPIACTTSQQICPNNPFGLCGSDPYGLPLTYIAVARPLHGTLGYDASGNFVYTPTSGYEGQTTFTYKVNDGFMDSARDTVTLPITDTVTAYYPSPAATCKGTPVNITLKDYDSCEEAPSTFSYAGLTKPTNGLLSGEAPNLTYTPTNANFTGMDSFTYKVSTGNSATNTVTIIVGDDNVSANSQTAMTGTNQPLNITLTASSPLGCTNSFNYTIVDNPTNGTLSGTGTSRTYTPTNGEGVDTFTFTVSDGVWNSPYPDAQVTIFVVAGPQLTAQCNPNGPGILLNWSLDAIVQQMELQGLNILDFKIYRATSSGGPYVDPIYTAGPTNSSYVDTTATPNDDYYYVVTFRYQDPSTSTIYESPYSNESHATGCCPGDSAFWVDSGPTAQEMAEWIMGLGVTVSNAKYTGDETAKGIFGGGTSAALPIDKGVILASGNITNAIGPNEDLEYNGTDYGNPGDADLDSLIFYASEMTKDAAILEFDFVSISNSIEFQYFFASEEYPDFQDSYDDVCAIFIDGTNITVVPGTSDPVSVYGINSGNNSQYYQDNPLAPPVVFNIGYNGLTTLLTAQTQITPNVVHHIKIAIADAKDHTFDSAIFLKTQSFPCQ